jgi:DNA-binding NtrC family response regulator
MNILVIDDEKMARMNIVNQLDSSVSVIESATFEDAKLKLERHKFDICYIDLKLDDSHEMLGLQLIPLAVKKGIYTVVMTSIEDDAIAEKAYESGCQDLYNKGNEKTHISETISKYFMSRDGFIESCFLKYFSPTKNKKYEALQKRLVKFAVSDIGILIKGPTGSGKTKIAAGIHEVSKRSGNFVSVNCANFSGDTLRCELFGHKKGAYTGAISDGIGKLLMADKGTILFDEVGSMSMEMQENLLTFLDSGTFYPVGSDRPVKVDARVICATLEDLHSRVAKGTFREDLFQRICGFTFTQPHLKERKEDIIPILKIELSKSKKVVIKEDARAALEEYSWPGNIRELLTLGQRIIRDDHGILTLEYVNDFIKNSTEKKADNIVEDHQYEQIKKIGLKLFLEEFSKGVMEKALSENNGSPTKAIAELKISSSTFYRYWPREDVSAKPLMRRELPGEFYEVQ